MEFALHLLRHGLISERQLALAMAAREHESPSFRALAVELGYLTPQQVCEVVAYVSERPMRFGEAAHALGLLTEAGIEALLTAQRARAPKLSEILLRQGAIDPRTLAIERGRADTPNE